MATLPKQAIFWHILADFLPEERGLKSCDIKSFSTYMQNECRVLEGKICDIVVLETAYLVAQDGIPIIRQADKALSTTFIDFADAREVSLPTQR